MVAKSCPVIFCPNNTNPAHDYKISPTHHQIQTDDGDKPSNSYHKTTSNRSSWPDRQIQYPPKLLSETLHQNITFFSTETTFLLIHYRSKNNTREQPDPPPNNS